MDIQSKHREWAQLNSSRMFQVESGKNAGCIKLYVPKVSYNLLSVAYRTYTPII